MILPFSRLSYHNILITTAQNTLIMFTCTDFFQSKTIQSNCRFQMDHSHTLKSIQSQFLYANQLYAFSIHYITITTGNLWFVSENTTVSWPKLGDSVLYCMYITRKLSLHVANFSFKTKEKKLEAASWNSITPTTVHQ